jgi:ribosomal protein S18 acetylase RimI-like enzyme
MVSIDHRAAVTDADDRRGAIAVRRVEAGAGAGAGADLVAGLAEVLVDCVEGGASVGFMHPHGLDQAAAFWTDVLGGAARGERLLFVAEDQDSGVVEGTVQVVLAAPENQPHRGEITKMLVHRRARQRGVGEALMRAAEAAALESGKTLLVLDTASADAERLYERLGWQRVGTIPDYALWPDGRYVHTVVFYKRLTRSGVAHVR